MVHCTHRTRIQARGVKEITIAREAVEWSARTRSESTPCSSRKAVKRRREAYTQIQHPSPLAVLKISAAASSPPRMAASMLMYLYVARRPTKRTLGALASASAAAASAW